jgi:hypothetical protein
MDVTEIIHTASEAPTAVSPPRDGAPYAQCDECGTAVDQGQRYCVNCGAHRRHVPDPAARYLAQSTSRSRAAVTAAAGAAPGARARRGSGLVVALLLALIPVTIAVGVVVGRSSNNNDAQLIRELSASQAQLAAASRAAGATSSAATTPATVTTTSAGRHTRAKRHAAAKQTASAKSANPNSTKAPSAVNGPASAAKQQQGAAIVNKLQHTNGTNYLNQLPSQVVVP